MRAHILSHLAIFIRCCKDRTFFHKYRFEITVSIALMVMGWNTARFLAFTSIAILPIGFLAFSKPLTRFKTLSSYLCSALFMIVTAISWKQPACCGSFGSFPVGLGVDSTFPEASVSFIDKHLQGAKVFNLLEDGGYLLYKLSPRIQVFIDGRGDFLYPFSFLEEYARALDSPAQFKNITQKYGADVALLKYSDEAKFSSMLGSDPDWPVVYLDDDRILRIRKEALLRYPNLKPLQGFDLNNPFRSMAPLTKNPKERQNVRDLLDDYEKEAPNSYKIALMQAYVAHLDRDRNREIELHKKVLRINPGCEVSLATLNALGETP